MSQVIDFKRARELATVAEARKRMAMPSIRLTKATRRQVAANARQQAVALRIRPL